VTFGQLAELTERAVVSVQALLAALGGQIAAPQVVVPEQRAMPVIQALHTDAGGGIAGRSATVTSAVVQAPHAHPILGVAERRGRGTRARLVGTSRDARAGHRMADARSHTAAQREAIAAGSRAGLAIWLRVARLGRRGGSRVRHRLRQRTGRGIRNADGDDRNGIARRLKQPQLLHFAARQAVSHGARAQHQRRNPPEAPRHSAPSAISRASATAYPVGKSPR